MANCNVTQKEVGGKDLLLKVCRQSSFTSVASSSTLTALAAHKAAVGDVVKFKNVGTNTVINTTAYFYVVSVPSSTTLTVAATPGGSALVMDDSESAMLADVFVAVGGLRSKSLSLSADGIDITNSDHAQWKTLLDGAGISSASISGGGVFSNDENMLSIEASWFARTLTCLMIIDVKHARIYEGCFKITSLEYSGDYDAESSFSISAESSGQVTLQAA